jgi:hypothetical protein
MIGSGMRVRHKYRRASGTGELSRGGRSCPRYGNDGPAARAGQIVKKGGNQSIDAQARVDRSDCLVVPCACLMDKSKVAPPVDRAGYNRSDSLIDCGSPLTATQYENGRTHG